MREGEEAGKEGDQLTRSVSVSFDTLDTLATDGCFVFFAFLTVDTRQISQDRNKTFPIGSTKRSHEEECRDKNRTDFQRCEDVLAALFYECRKHREALTVSIARTAHVNRTS